MARARCVGAACAGRLLAALLLLGCCHLLGVAKADTGAGAVMSNIIPSAGEAELANGIGDLPPAGPCKADIKAFCSDVTPGEGRLSECLVERQREMRDGNTPGRKVTQKCIDDIVAFKIDRSSNINKDVPLARACKDDVAKWCQYANDKNAPGSTLACLRAKKNKMGAGCKKEIFRTQQDVVEDYRFDYKLYARCKADVSSLCPDVEPGSGGELDCLESKRQHVSWECQDQMFREEQETGDDIRLSVRLFNKCLQDYRRFCRKVPPGHMRVQECLEDNMDQAKFSPQCKEELDGILASRVADFRLDTALRDACETDVEATCGHSLESMDEDDKAGGTLTSTVLNCLQQYEDELKETECRAEVHRRKQRAARDIRLDEVLYEACSDDRTEFCADVKPGSARVIRCLQDHRSTLSQSCTAALFDHEVRMAEDIDFKYPMKKACAWEISAFCKDVPHGHARVVRCLTDNLDNTDMTSACKKQVERDQNMAARDYRLNFRLSAACGGDISRLCGDTCLQGGAAGSCGGVVLQCLQDNEDNVTDAACQEEIFYFELMEVRDFRNDVILAEACRNDVAQFCQDVEPGDGRVHKCLRGAMGQLSPRCRKEEQKLQAKEMRDVRLRPKLNRACSEEKAVYCKDVKPGRARVVQCLMENMAQPDFGQECLEELEKREDAVKNDYRMDVGVATNCEADVTTFCPDERSQLRGNATVLKCLVANFASLAEPCQAEMSRAVRVALWDYKPGAPLTQACDKDVSDKCPGSSQARVSGSPFTIGAVGRCLSKAVVQHSRLDAQCRALTLVAAPKDMRAMFDGSESSGALVARLADLQAAAGLDRVLVDPYGPNAVTVTGWVAIACIFSIVVVLLGSVFVLIRRLQGQRVAAYTQLAAKSGDV